MTLVNRTGVAVTTPSSRMEMPKRRVADNSDPAPNSTKFPTLCPYCRVTFLEGGSSDARFNQPAAEILKGVAALQLLPIKDASRGKLMLTIAVKFSQMIRVAR